MRPTTYLILREELRKNDYGIGEKHNVENLFRIYSEFEIRSFNDLMKDHKDFYDFIINNINDFRGILDNNGEPSTILAKTIRATARHYFLALDSIHNKHYSDYHKEQEKFVKTIEDILNHERPKILEVGSGNIPYSSILLAHDIGRISSMDKFSIAEKALNSLNITPHNKYFERNEHIENFDLIIGQRPCSAIQNIVLECSAQSKSYFLQLCGCEAPTKLPSGWIQVLQEIDPKIQYNFVDNNIYAFNLESM